MTQYKLRPIELLVVVVVVVGRCEQSVPCRLYASTPNDQTLYFGLPECDLTMDQLLDRGTAVSGQESPRSF